MCACHDKQNLRKLMKERLKAFANKKSESQYIIESLLEDEAFNKAEIVLAFAPLKSEPDITPILSDERIALPYIEDGIMHFSSDKNLDKSQLGFLEPINKVPISYEKAVILVPMLAFDNRLYRLGRGGGYYDRYLQKNRDKLYSIGLAFSVSKLDFLEVEEHDQKLDKIICPNL